MYEEINNIKNDYLKVRNFCKESYMYPKKLKQKNEKSCKISQRT